MKPLMNDKAVKRHENVKDVTSDSVYIDFETNSCIPFVNIRNPTESAVLRFLSVFSGRTASSLAQPREIFHVALIPPWSFNGSRD